MNKQFVGDLFAIKAIILHFTPMFNAWNFKNSRIFFDFTLINYMLNVVAMASFHGKTLLY